MARFGIYPSPEVIEQNLLKNGITADKTIILYSDNQLAAYRVFWALKWAGVKDIRVLNGNLSTWMDANLPTETTVNTPIPETHFGATIPAILQLILKRRKKLCWHNKMV